MEQPGILSMEANATANPRRPVSAQDWEDQRPNIEQLYSVEDKTLDEVMGEMEQVHGFRATKRQYQKRISQWRLEKKVKDREIRFIAEKQKTRKAAENKDTAFRVRGRPVDQQKITRTLKRKKISNDAMTSVPGSIPSTPSDVSYYTPAAGSHPTPKEEDPDIMLSLMTHSPTIIPSWNALSTQSQYLSPTYLGLDEPYTPQIPTSIAGSPVYFHSPAFHWNTPSNLGAVGSPYTPVYMSDSESPEEKLARLIKLLKESEESENVNYMQTMLDINSLVYEFVTLNVKEYCATSGATNQPCYICRALNKIGKDAMHEKVESERLLLEAIAVSEGRFGEDCTYSCHLRMELLFLYRNWSCRTDDVNGVSTRILKMALRSPHNGIHLNLFIRLIHLIYETRHGQIGYMCGLHSGGKCLPWVEYVVSLLGGQSQVLSLNDDELRIAQRILWNMVKLCEKCEDINIFQPMVRGILQLGPIMGQEVYFWAAAFLSACCQQWEAIFSSRQILSTAAVQASLPGSVLLKVSLNRLAKDPYRLVESADGFKINGISSSTHEEPRIGQQQREVCVTEFLREPPQNLDELAELLIEFFLMEGLKSPNPEFTHLIQNTLYSTLKIACQAGNSRLITVFATTFSRGCQQYIDKWCKLVNSHGYQFKQSLICVAARAGHEKVVRALIDAGADVNGWDMEEAPILIAVEAGHSSIVSLLIQEGAITDCFLIGQVIDFSNRELCNAWIESTLRNDGWYGLFNAILYMVRERKYDLFDPVFRQIRNVLDAEKDDTTLSPGRTGLASKINHFSRKLNKALGTCRGYHDEQVQLLLCTLSGLSTELQATRILRDVLLELTGNSKALIHIDPWSNLPILHEFVYQNAPNALSIYLQLGADVSVIDKYGNTGLHLAVRLNLDACARNLLQAGINLHEEDAWGRTALQLAAHSGNQAMYELLTMWYS